MSRLFVGLTIPDEAALRVRLSIRRYRLLEPERVPRRRWHITIFFLGEVEDFQDKRRDFLAPIPSSFVPTVRLTHMGQGLQEHQLWAYVEPNSQLSRLSQTLRRRARKLGAHVSGTQQGDFVPHIHVADFGADIPESGVPDWPLLTTFSAREAYLMESTVKDGERQYTPVGTLPLVARARV